MGISRYAAAIGEYNYSESIGFTPFLIGGMKTHDVIGAVRISSPRRFAPYAVMGGGVARIQDVIAIGRLAFTLAATKPALALGGGFNFAVTRRWGIQSEFRAIRPVDFPWYARSTGGLYFRF